MLSIFRLILVTGGVKNALILMTVAMVVRGWGVPAFTSDFPPVILGLSFGE